MWKVMLPVDGSERSLDAVRHVIEWARQGMALEVVLAHVQAPATLYEMVTVRDADRIAAASLEAGLHLLAPARALLDGAGIRCTEEVAVGDPVHVLLDLVDTTEAQAVVLAAQGHGALEGVLVGSVSQELLRLSRVPVTLVKHPEFDPDAAEEAAEAEA